MEAKNKSFKKALQARKEAAVIAAEIHEHTKRTGEKLGAVICSLATDFHPVFTERIMFIVDNLNGWNAYTEYPAEYEKEYKDFIQLVIFAL